MDIRHIVRAGAVVMVAALLLTLAFAAAPGGVKAAFAQETAAPAEADAAKAAEGEVTEAQAAEGEAKAEAAEGEAAEGEAKAEGEEEAEIPHKVGNPTPSQQADLRNAWAGIPGYDLLIVAILGLVVTVGVIGFGAFKQSRV